MLAPILFAQQNKPTGSPFDRPEIIWGSLGLAAALMVGALLIYIVDKWRRRAAMEEREAGLELTDFRAMYESGEITEAEYNRLRLRVADRVKNPAVVVLAVPATEPAPPANSAVPPLPRPFPPGYFDDPPTSPPTNSPPPGAPGGTSPSA